MSIVVDTGVMLAAADTTPAVTVGAMWDLTVNADHDFYIATTAGPVLVHNDDCDGEPPVIYREGTPRPGNLTPSPVDEGMLSFRDSLSNPWIPPEDRPLTSRLVFRPSEPYIGIDTSQLPSGSVNPDNIPPGHVSVSGVSPQDLRNAVIERGTFP